MAVNVDPFIIPIPDEFKKDSQLLAYFTYLHRWNHDIWTRLGGGNDAIDDLQVSEVYEQANGFAAVQELREDLEDNISYNYKEEFFSDEGVTQEIPVFRAVTVTGDYTAVSYDFIAATTNSTITLPKYPDDNEVISVLNVNGKEVIVNGNGKLINGSDKTITNKKNTTINYFYFVDLNAWYMR